MKDETIKQISECENLMNTYAGLAILLGQTLKRDHVGVKVRKGLSGAIADLEIMSAYFYDKGKELANSL